MAFSERQFIFAEYLLNKLGFNDKKLIVNYLKKLEDIYGRYSKEWRTETFKNGYKRDYWILKYSNSDCIEELLKEIKIKKDANKIQDLDFNFNSKISATDLSSFDFCPASYSISKSFKIEFPTSEDKRLIGIDLHETLRLINKKIPFQLQESDVVESNIQFNEKIRKIKNCELVFSGHESQEKNYFLNNSKNYIGQPDYIFKDPKGKYFVVEEKFKYLNNYISPENYNYDIIEKKRSKIKNTFHSNHIVQLQSYIDFIEDYNIDYGILIYWFYDFQQTLPKIHSFSLKIINRKENQILLEQTFSNLENFRTNKSIDFKENVNPNKCAACSVNKYCGHKSGNMIELKIPYSKKDLYLKYVVFPEELKKDKME